MIERKIRKHPLKEVAMPGRPDLLIMCGLSFSGKSTMATELETRFGAEVISLDAINSGRGLEGGSGVSEEEWRKTHGVALEELDALMAMKTPIIVVDDTSCFRFLRDNYRFVADRYGYRVRVVVMDTPMEVIRERRRMNSGDRADISDEIFDSHCRNFEWPDSDEKTHVFHHDSHFEEWFSKHLHYDSETEPAGLGAF